MARRKKIAVCIWACVVLCGFGEIVRYQATPASGVHDAPERWPSKSFLVHDPIHFTLVMSVHPQCPCSSASIRELAQLMSRSEGLVTTHVLFTTPGDTPPEWARTRLWESASALSGVRVWVDPDGRESTLFHAAASGQVCVYGADGTLLYSGGITGSRGHEGDNDGLDAVLAIIRGNAPAVRRMPVYGCALINCPTTGAAK